MKLISSLLVFIFILASCQLQDSQKNAEIVVENIIEKKNQIIEKKTKKKDIKKTRLYLVGEPYYIQGVKHIHEENYSYSKNTIISANNKTLKEYIIGNIISDKLENKSLEKAKVALKKHFNGTLNYWLLIIPILYFPGILLKMIKIIYKFDFSKNIIINKCILKKKKCQNHIDLQLILKLMKF